MPVGTTDMQPWRRSELELEDLTRAKPNVELADQTQCAGWRDDACDNGPGRPPQLMRAHRVLVARNPVPYAMPFIIQAPCGKGQAATQGMHAVLPKVPRHESTAGPRASERGTCRAPLSSSASRLPHRSSYMLQSPLTHRVRVRAPRQASHRPTHSGRTSANPPIETMRAGLARGLAAGRTQEARKQTRHFPLHTQEGQPQVPGGNPRHVGRRGTRAAGPLSSAACGGTVRRWSPERGSRDGRAPRGAGHSACRARLGGERARLRARSRFLCVRRRHPAQRAHSLSCSDAGAGARRCARLL